MRRNFPPHVNGNTDTACIEFRTDKQGTEPTTRLIFFNGAMKAHLSLSFSVRYQKCLFFLLLFSQRLSLLHFSPPFFVSTFSLGSLPSRFDALAGPHVAL